MIYIGADHRGYQLKETLKEYLDEQGCDFTDCGAYTYNPEDDFPDYGERVARSVQGTSQCCGILLCGSGQGMCMAANRLKGVRGVLAYSQRVVKEAVEHDHANVMCIPADDYTMEEVKLMVETFLQSEPSSKDKYERRVAKLDDLGREL